MKIIISANSSWNIYNFRLNLINKLQKLGHEIIIISPNDNYTKLIEQKNIRLVNLSLNRNNLNFFSNFILILKYFYIFKIEKPDIYLGFTIKPNLFGTAALFFFKKTKVVNFITGFGTFYLSSSKLLFYFISFLYKLIFYRSTIVFFQNKYDQDYFVLKKIIKHKKSKIINGSGVDINYFFYSKNLPKKKFDTFLLISRIIKDKGIFEFIEAAKIIKQKYPLTVFKILGSVDFNNRNKINLEYFNKAKKENIVEHIKFKEDIREYIINSDCIVLPSYREGTSMSLLEAASMGRPLISTDVPGCNNIVFENINGFLCKSKSFNSLSDSLIKFINTSNLKRINMGLNSRDIVINNFDIEKVNNDIINKINITL